MDTSWFKELMMAAMYLLMSASMYQGRVRSSAGREFKLASVVEFVAFLPTAGKQTKGTADNDFLCLAFL